MSEYLASIKFEGELIKDGFLDVRKSAEILTGIDEIFRFYLYQKNPDISKLDFELPVRIRKGSWETLIPNEIGEWVMTAIGAGGTAYLISSLKELGKNDAKDKGIKDVFKGIIKGLKWCIEIRKHLKRKRTQFPDAKIKNLDGVDLIGIPDDEGNLLYVPKEYLELYTKTPENLLDKLTKHIQNGRELAIGFSDEEKGDVDDTGKIANISFLEKPIFYEDSELDDFLFPELKHGAYVELDGHVTRGNEKTNSIGFQYNNHILTCYPLKGGIVKDKELLFTNCVIKGYVDRQSQSGDLIERRPRIRFLELVPIEDENKSRELFK